MTQVDVTFEGAVAVVTLNRPPMNAFSAELTADLDAAVGRCEDPAVRAVIVTGKPNFAAGADITEFKEAMARSGEDALANRLSEVVRRLELLPKPVVAAVRGYALGGGLELAMGCDVRFLAEDATVGQPEINLGIIPGAGGTQRLTRLIGPGKARDLVYTGRFVSAAEALDIGLADRVVPGDELDAAALEYATALAAGPTRAIGEAKRAINEGLEMPMDAALSLEAEAFRSAFATRDADEGVTAFLEKRKPRFKGE